MNERLEAIVSGQVQMVMYRDFAQRAASKLRLVGWVKNLSDGTVQLVAEGERAALEQLVKRLHEGSLLSSVTGVRASWLPADGQFKKFTIAYD